MQSATTTVFKQKKCPKCGNNHDNEGVLCSFCVAKAEMALSKVQQSPDSFWVKCLIEREGNTTLVAGGIHYTFKPNKNGDCVCEIINQGHYSQIIKSEFYEPYTPPVGEVKADYIGLLPEEQDRLATEMKEAGKNMKEIAQALSEMSGENVPWQRVVKHLNDKTKQSGA